MKSTFVDLLTCVVVHLLDNLFVIPATHTHPSCASLLENEAFFLIHKKIFKLCFLKTHLFQ